MAEYYGHNDWRDYHLSHHGIPGQQWGKRNGPPYPLNPVISAKVRMSRINNDDGDWENTARERKKIKKEILDPTEKDYPIEKFEELKRLPKTYDKESVRAEINSSDYGEGSANLGRNYNCPNCAMAYDMTERGYDVKARPKQNGSNVGDIAKYYKGGKLDPVTKDVDWELSETPRKFLESVEEAQWRNLKQTRRNFWQAQHDAVAKADSAILAQGEGARGIIVCGWDNGDDTAVLKKRTSSYHAFNYSVENGNVIYRDTQSSREWKYNEGFKSNYFNNKIDPREIHLMRTDNLEPDPSITECIHSNKR